MGPQLQSRRPFRHSLFLLSILGLMCAWVTPPPSASAQASHLVSTRHSVGDKFLYLPAVIRGKSTWSFVDPFDQNLGWQTFGETGASTYLSGGKYHLKQTAEGYNVKAIAPISPAEMPASYSVSTEVEIVPGSDGDVQLGILFDWLDTNRFYRFLISPSTGMFWIHKFESGWQVLYQGTVVLSPGVNTLQVERIGAQIKVYVSDLSNPLYIISDSTYALGRAGLIVVAPKPLTAAFAAGAFDNFTVRQR